MQKQRYYFLILSITLFVTCNKAEQYNVTGVIKSINEEEKKLLIDHDEIPGFMMKMEMFFNVEPNVDFKQFSVDDSVSFELFITKDNSYTINYNNLGKSLLENSEDDFFYDPYLIKYKLKKPGEFVDNITLLSLENKEIQLSDFKSKFIAISFIFSKCPMPNMCPASIYKNQYLSTVFKTNDIKFLMISFDYLYDTPEVLNNIYGNINTENLIFLSSYNHIDDIYTLTQQAGVGYWGVEENNIGHTMRTIILDQNLKLVKTLDGMDWNPGEAKKSIENLIKIYQ